MGSSATLVKSTGYEISPFPNISRLDTQLWTVRQYLDIFHNIKEVSFFSNMGLISMEGCRPNAWPERVYSEEKRKSLSYSTDHLCCLIILRCITSSQTPRMSEPSILSWSYGRLATNTSSTGYMHVLTCKDVSISDRTWKSVCFFFDAPGVTASIVEYFRRCGWWSQRRLSLGLRISGHRRLCGSKSRWRCLRIRLLLSVFVGTSLLERKASIRAQEGGTIDKVLRVES